MVQALLDIVREGQITPSSITTADVASRAGVPIGSLYEYFEDLGAIADAAVDQLLHRHDELLEECARNLPSTPTEIVDVLVDTYGRLYRDETGYLSLRFSTLFQPYHRQWLSQSLESFMRRMIEADAAAFPTGPETMKRLQLLFTVGDAVLQEVYRGGADPDPEVLAEGRTILHLAIERLARGQGEPAVPRVLDQASPGQASADQGSTGQGSTESDTSNPR
jgi:AcrR family transcriptional regulator